MLVEFLQDRFYIVRYNLPWWRVVNSKYKVVINDSYGFEEQIRLLRKEGHIVYEDGRIRL